MLPLSSHSCIASLYPIRGCNHCTHHCIQSLHPITESSHCIPSLHPITVSHHYIPSLYPITVSHHCIPLLYPITVSHPCIPSLDPIAVSHNGIPLLQCPHHCSLKRRHFQLHCTWSCPETPALAFFLRSSANTFCQHRNALRWRPKTKCSALSAYKAPVFSEQLIPSWISVLEPSLPKAAKFSVVFNVFLKLIWRRCTARLPACSGFIYVPYKTKISEYEFLRSYRTQYRLWNCWSSELEENVTVYQKQMNVERENVSSAFKWSSYSLILLQ